MFGRKVHGRPSCVSFWLAIQLLLHLAFFFNIRTLEASKKGTSHHLCLTNPLIGIHILSNFTSFMEVPDMGSNVWISKVFFVCFFAPK